jgi:chemotaxis protein MotB
MGALGDNAAPVIIRKKKKVVAGDGHHGGAWKVAYADFVTAMMAFFLLMWLLNATTEKQRKGIADYFSPTIPVSRVSGGGDGAFGGNSIFSEEGLPQNGTGATNARPTESRQARGQMGLDPDGAGRSAGIPSPESQRQSQLDEVAQALAGGDGDSSVSPKARRHILTRVTDEGLVIELFERDEARLFAAGTARPTELLVELAAIIASVSAMVQNGFAIEGYTRSVPVVRAENPVWDLSIARADRMRRLLQDAGLPKTRMRRVTGNADRAPVVADAMALRNNRLEVILLRSD